MCISRNGPQQQVSTKPAISFKMNERQNIRTTEWKMYFWNGPDQIRSFYCRQIEQHKHGLIYSPEIISVKLSHGGSVTSLYSKMHRFCIAAITPCLQCFSSYRVSHIVGCKYSIYAPYVMHYSWLLGHRHLP